MFLCSSRIIKIKSYLFKYTVKCITGKIICNIMLYNLFLSKVLNKEYYTLQNSSEKRLVELESKCKEQGDKLAVYEKLEQELDDVIMQAAESKE